MTTDVASGSDIYNRAERKRGRSLNTAQPCVSRFHYVPPALFQGEVLRSPMLSDVEPIESPYAIASSTWADAYQSDQSDPSGLGLEMLLCDEVGAAYEGQMKLEEATDSALARKKVKRTASIRTKPIVRVPSLDQWIGHTHHIWPMPVIDKQICSPVKESEGLDDQVSPRAYFANKFALSDEEDEASDAYNKAMRHHAYAKVPVCQSCGQDSEPADDLQLVEGLSASVTCRPVSQCSLHSNWEKPQSPKKLAKKGSFSFI